MKKSDVGPAVLGIGNALIDIINILEDDALLEQFGLPRGSMTLVDTELSRQIFEATLNNKRQITTGGSAANTIHTLAALGSRCGYLGKIGADDLGKVFIEEFRRNHIETHMMVSAKDTGRVMALVSPDSERTMATYLGAAADLKPEELAVEIFKGYDYLYIEGYLVQDHQLIERAVDIARENGLKSVIDLSSFNVVEQNLEFLRKLVGGKIDVVFANEDEALAFTGKGPEESLEEMVGMCELAVVKVGKEGSFIGRGAERVKAGIIPVKAVDTTGAGDNYAAGFLYGLTRGYSLETCGSIGALVAGQVVEVMGAKITEAQWPAIRAILNQMED